MANPNLMARSCRAEKALVSSAIQHELFKKFNLRGSRLANGQLRKSKMEQFPHFEMNDEDWERIEIRAEEREEFSQPCAICRDELGCRAHVLLSCSHVFHKNCIEAFERFTCRKVCPMCRKVQYETRTVQNGRDSYLHKSATRIQSAWRMYIARSTYIELRKSVPPQDPHMRKKFFEDKLASLIERVTKSVSYHLDAFIEEFDRNIEKSRNMFDVMDHTFDWDSVIIKVASRGDENCPICLVSINKGSLTAIKPKFQQPKSFYVLSCSHMFHQSCLNTMETFSSQFVCPICRSAYFKKCF